MTRTVMDQAVSAFAAYAVMDSPALPPNVWSKLQLRLTRWETRQFGWQPMERAVLGVGEEVGELIDAWMTPEDPQSLMLDAFGDIAVYSMQICTHLRADYGELLMLDQIPPPNGQGLHWLAKMASWAGQLNHATLKALQKIRGMEDKDKFRNAALLTIANIARISRGFVEGDFRKSYYITVKEVAEKVLLRDWTNNKTNGGQP